MKKLEAKLEKVQNQLEDMKANSSDQVAEIQELQDSVSQLQKENAIL